MKTCLKKKSRKPLHIQQDTIPEKGTSMNVDVDDDECEKLPQTRIIHFETIRKNQKLKSNWLL